MRFRTQPVTYDWLADPVHGPILIDDLSALMRELSTDSPHRLERAHLRRILTTGFTRIDTIVDSRTKRVVAAGLVVDSPQLDRCFWLEEGTRLQSVASQQLGRQLGLWRMEQARIMGARQVMLTTSYSRPAYRIFRELDWTDSPLRLLRVNPQTSRLPMADAWPASRFTVREIMPWEFSGHHGPELTAQVAALMFPEGNTDLTALQARGHRLVTSPFTTFYAGFDAHGTLQGIITLALAPQLLEGKAKLTGLTLAGTDPVYARLARILVLKAIQRAKDRSVTKLDAIVAPGSAAERALRLRGFEPRTSHLLVFDLTQVPAGMLARRANRLVPA